MSSAGLVNITINGRQVQARPGQTVLQAAAEAGITIPALCNHPHLRPEGSCRVCVVEIEKQRSLQPACTFPVFEGMVVHTESEKAVESRRMALQMIFSERSHYCMFCPMSGSPQTTDCELQKLAYQYELDSWAYTPDYMKSWPVDASRKYFVMDHGRCILCRRCVRACAQIAANHTLGVYHRGARSMVCADDNVPFGESSCVSCGTCLQVCPTGALFDRRSVYMGHDAQTTRTPAVCAGCAVGCGIEAVIRDNHLLRIEGDWNAANCGLLCVTGRFETTEPRHDRILRPMVRRDGRFVETSWDEALNTVAARLRQYGLVAGLISPRMTSEALATFNIFCQEVLNTNEVALLYGDVPPSDLGARATLQDVAAADCIIVMGGDPLEEQKVVGYLVKRARDAEARVIVVNDRPTKLDRYAHVHLDLQDISHADQSPFERLRTTYHLRIEGVVKLKSAVEAARRPVVLYSAGLSTTVYAALRAMPDKVRFMPLIHGTNSAGAARLGLTARPVRGEALYLMAGDDMPPPDGSSPTAGRREIALPESRFTVVHAAWRSRWTEQADVVLPALTWTEKSGHFINMEGRTLEIKPLVSPPRSVQSDRETLLQLAVRMGCALSYQEITEIAGAVS